MNTQDNTINKKWKYKNQLADTTHQMYQTPIQHYIKATGMTLKELYEEAIQEEEQQIPRYRKKINDHILEYQIYLDELNIKESSKSNYLNVVKSFYKSLDITLPTINNKYDEKPDPKNTEKMINKELIKLMIQNARTRDKAILSFAAMTGQSPDEIRHMTIQQVMDSWNNELETKLFTIEDIFTNRDEILSLEATKLAMLRHKTKHHYWVYLPSETSKYIIDYVYERQHGTNDKIQANSTQELLFVSKTGKKFSRTAVGKIFTTIGKRCGFETPELFDDETRLLLTREEGQHRVWRAYNFRKYFTNTCRRYAGTTLDSTTEHIFSGRELADFWIGHTIKGSIKHYLQYDDTDVDEMKQQYLQVLPYLSVETEVTRYTTEDKQKLKEIEANYEQVQKELKELREYIHSKQQVEKYSKKYSLDE